MCYALTVHVNIRVTKIEKYLQLMTLYMSIPNYLTGIYDR